MYVCGWNNEGQLGLGDNANRASLHLLTSPNDMPISSFAIGAYHSTFLAGLRWGARDTRLGRAVGCGRVGWWHRCLRVRPLLSVADPRPQGGGGCTKGCLPPFGGGGRGRGDLHSGVRELHVCFMLLFEMIYCVLVSCSIPRL